MPDTKPASDPTRQQEILHHTTMPSPEQQQQQPKESSSAASTANIEDDEVIDEGSSFSFDDIGLSDAYFLTAPHECTVRRTFEWTLASPQRFIRVSLEYSDDDPGALQSGHYLWPAAELLVDYIVGKFNDNKSSNANCYYQQHPSITSILELGAGCALASLAALQIWQPTVQVVLVTDHDASVLDRARDNYETTVQAFVDDAAKNDQDLNAVINELASIPVCFEELSWGQHLYHERVHALLQEHVVASDATTANVKGTIDLVLGTDLLYDAMVVRPLLDAFVSLGGERFLLAQSFAYDDETEREIDKACHDLCLTRTILYDEREEMRIQEFVKVQ
jgi:predicted nicotinamide N-methyase